MGKARGEGIYERHYELNRNESRSDEHGSNDLAAVRRAPEEMKAEGNHRDGPEQKSKPEGAVSRWLRRARRWEPVAAFAGVVILAVYTYYARQQASAIREGNILSNRAWVTVKNIETTHLDVERVKVRLILDNTGRTTAAGWCRWGLMAFGETKRVPPEQMALTVRDPNDSAFVIGPGHEHALVDAEWEIPVPYRQGIESGAIRFFVFGRIEYDDGFGQMRRTTFSDWMIKRAPALWVQSPDNNAAD